MDAVYRLGHCLDVPGVTAALWPLTEEGTQAGVRMAARSVLAAPERTTDTLADWIARTDSEGYDDSSGATLALGQLCAPTLMRAPALECAPTPERVARLLALLGDAERHMWQRRTAAFALGEVGEGNPAVLAALRTVAEDEIAKVLVRRDAAQATLRLGDDAGAAAALVAIERSLEPNKEWELRTIAMALRGLR